MEIKHVTITDILKYSKKCIDNLCTVFDKVQYSAKKS